MCDTADSLMFTQYVWYSKKLNAQTICEVQQTVKCSFNKFCTADCLMLTLYVWYIRQFNADTICEVQQTV